MRHSNQASAKSGAGIGLPDEVVATIHAASVFFIVVRTATNYGGLCGGGEIRAG